MKLYEYISACLRAFGCRRAFGVPGSFVMPIWQNLSNVELTLCSHEQEASYVATGYAKISGELTAVISTGSPGVANCVTGIAGANMDSVPIIYISGKNDLRLQNTGIRQEESRTNRNFESTELMAPITKYSIQITDIRSAAEQFRFCCATAIACRAGSVHVCVPQNVQSMELPSDVVIPTKEECNTVPYTCMPVLKKPLIIVGWGCFLARVVDKVYELALLTNAPIIVTSKAYCCIRCEHPLFLGKLGYGYNIHLEEFLKNYRAKEILVFGSTLGRKDICESCADIISQASIHVYTCETDDVMLHCATAEIHETTDLAGMVKNWIRCAPAIETDYTLRSQIAICKEKQHKLFKSLIYQSDTMAMALDAIGELGKGITITADAGNNLLNAAVLCHPKECGGLFINDGIRSMGSGLCETVGMAIADPTRYYIAVVGDGGMLMNGNVMYLAKRLELPVAFVVINNSSLGRVRIGQTITEHFIGSDLGGIDFLLYANAFGLSAFRTDNPNDLVCLLQEAICSKQTRLLEYVSNKDELPIKLKLEGVY